MGQRARRLISPGRAAVQALGAPRARARGRCAHRNGRAPRLRPPAAQFFPCRPPPQRPVPPGSPQLLFRILVLTPPPQDPKRIPRRRAPRRRGAARCQINDPCHRKGPGLLARPPPPFRPPHSSATAPRPRCLHGTQPCGRQLLAACHGQRGRGATAPGRTLPLPARGDAPASPAAAWPPPKRASPPLCVTPAGQHPDTKTQAASPRRPPA
jgi:hypothetical protein